MNRRSLLLTSLGAVLAGKDPARAQTSSLPAPSGAVASVGLQACNYYVGLAGVREPSFVVGLDQQGTKVVAYPLVVSSSARVVKTANRIVVLLEAGDYGLHLISFTADPGKTDPRWTAGEITNPLQFIQRLAGVYSKTRAEKAFSSKAYQALLGPGSHAEALAKLKSDVNAADPGQIADLEKMIAVEVASIANSALEATPIALYSDLGFNQIKVPVQVYRMHQALSPLGEIPKSQRAELLVLNRWLLDRYLDYWHSVSFEYRRQQDFAGASVPIVFRGDLRAETIGFIIQDPCFKLRDVKQTPIPRKGNLSILNYKLRLPDAGERDAYQLDPEGFIVVGPTLEYAMDGDLKISQKIR